MVIFGERGAAEWCFSMIRASYIIFFLVCSVRSRDFARFCRAGGHILALPSVEASARMRGGAGAKASRAITMLRLRGGRQAEDDFAEGGSVRVDEIIREVAATRERPVADRMRRLWEFKDKAMKMRTEDKKRLDAKVLVRAEEWLKDPSVLVRHEVCYVVGQTCGEEAIPLLEKVLGDADEDVMVRHEAAEAIGAVGSKRGMAALIMHSSDVRPEVAETCQLACSRLEWLRSTGGSEVGGKGGFSSIDPAPSTADKEGHGIEAMGETLCDARISMFDRYRALFGLRDVGTDEAVAHLQRGLLEGSSALLRHEVAFAMGQLASAACRPSLEKALANASEHPMVRHEAAEALGAAGDDSAKQILERYLRDPCPVVAESCEVALDMLGYWSDFRVS